METDVIRGELVTPGSFDPALLAMRSFLAGYSGRTLEGYTIDMDRWDTWCSENGFELFDIQRVHVDLYCRGLESAGYAPATICRRIGTVRVFYRYCDQEGLIGRNPAAYVKTPRRPDESRTLGLDRMELGGFLATAATCRLVDHALACLLTFNALRVSEACGANIEALGSERGHRTLTILGKGSKIATVPLAPRTARALDQVIGEDRYEGPILLTRAGTRLTRHDAGRIVRRLAKKAGITKRIGPHSLRHSAITAALDAGVPMRDVTEFARHADPRTTMHYDRARHNLDRHATYVVAAFIAGGA